MFSGKNKLFLCTLLISISLLTACAPRRQPDLNRIFLASRQTKGKSPIIIIPGILGSQLINKRTGERVWPRGSRSKDDDLELPVSPNIKENSDDLIATDILYTAKVALLLPEIEVYHELLMVLENNAGYKRASIDNPPPDGDRDTYYVFYYDWRRDNVETAQLLGQKIRAIKERLGRPGLKFSIVAHSMGGLIARYYAMYGARDVLDEPAPVADWSGARDINKLIMVGTPNEGSMEALKTLVEGYSITGGDRRRFAIAKKLEADTAFTLPSVYQLLPNSNIAQFYDDNLRPLALDLYDVSTWRDNRWTIFNKNYQQKIAKRMRKQHGEDWERHYDDFFAGRASFLKAALARAQQFHRALSNPSAQQPIDARLFIFGGDCEPTLRAPIISRDQTGVRTYFRSKSVPVKDGKLTRKAFQEAMFEPGDGRVTRRSLLAWRPGENRGDRLFPSSLGLSYAVFGCEIHGDLPNNPTFQNNVLTLLVNDARPSSGETKAAGSATDKKTSHPN